MESSAVRTKRESTIRWARPALDAPIGKDEPALVDSGAALSGRGARRGGRGIECTALEMRHRCKPIGGSNPSLSALELAAIEISPAISSHLGQPIKGRPISTTTGTPQ